MLGLEVIDPTVAWQGASLRDACSDLPLSLFEIQEARGKLNSALSVLAHLPVQDVVVDKSTSIALQADVTLGAIAMSTAMFNELQNALRDLGAPPMFPRRTNRPGVELLGGTNDVLALLRAGIDKADAMERIAVTCNGNGAPTGGDKRNLIKTVAFGVGGVLGVAAIVLGVKKFTRKKR
jgi:hypothetical protein